MRNKMDILSNEYVFKYGIDFNLGLWFTSYSDEVLDNTEDENGQPFTGLAYELYDNGNVAYYCYYKNGFKEGDYIKFHYSGKIKSVDYMIKGQTRGDRKIWYENEKLKFEGEFKFGICLKYTEWDQQGNIIGQKRMPLEDKLGLIARLSEGENHESF